MILYWCWCMNVRKNSQRKRNRNHKQNKSCGKPANRFIQQIEAMNQVDINNIVDVIKAIPSVIAVCWDRVFSEPPVSSEQPGIYLIVQLSTDPVDTIVSKNALISIRAVAHNSSVSQSQLYSLINSITDAIVTEEVQEDYWFGVFKVCEQPYAPPLMDDKTRWEILKHYLFYFSL